MSVSGAVPAEVRLATLLFGKPRTTLEGGKDVPFVELKEAVDTASKASGGVMEPSEFKGILDWHAIKCTQTDLQEISNQCRVADSTKIDVKKLLDRMQRIHKGTLKVTAPKVTVQELRKKLEALLKKKFVSLFAAFEKFDPAKTGDITAEQFRSALARHGFVMDDETFETFCNDWMAGADATKLRVTGNINYEAFKRKFGGLAVSGGSEFVSKFHDEGMRKHLEKLHARDKYTKLRFAPAERIISALERLMPSRFSSVHEAFQSFDQNRSGTVDSTEFQTAIEKFANLRMKDDEYEKLARHFKLNLLKQLSFQDFSRAFGSLITGSVQGKTMADRNDASLKALKTRVKQASNTLGNTTAANAAKQFAAKLGNKFDQLRVAFNSMDLDSSGAIEPDELRKVLLGYNLQMTDPEWRKFLQGYNRDAEGRIQREEFYKKFGSFIKGSHGGGGPGANNAAEREKMMRKVNKHQKPMAEVSAEVATQRLKQILASKYDDTRKAFLTIDLDNSGVIEAAEFRQALEKFNLVMTDAEFSKFLAANKLNVGSKVDFAKFQKKFSAMITGEYNGHGATERHQAVMKAHKEKVYGRSNDAQSKSAQAKDSKKQAEPSKPKAAAEQSAAAKTSSSDESAAAVRSPAGGATAAAPVGESRKKPADARKRSAKPKPVRYMSLLDAIARLENLLGKKARKLPAALIAMDLEATSTLMPDECRRVLAQFGINLTAKDFRQLCQLYDGWDDSGVVNYVALAKGFGADLAQRVYDVSPMKKAANAKVVADARVALKEGQEYLLDKLRNAYEKVVSAMFFADTNEAGFITDEDFVSILARQGGVRLTKAELSAFCDYYNKPSTRFDNSASKHIDYKKFSKLFDSLRNPVDFTDAKVKKRFKAQNEEAEAYLRDKLRNAYPKVLRAFKSLMENDPAGDGSQGVSHAAFRRMLTRFGAVRMTNQEWAGFISKYDSNRDGFISFDELKVLFKDYAERDHAKRVKAANARQQVVEDRYKRRQRAREVEQKLIGPPVPVEGAEDVLALHFQNKLGTVAKTISMLDREGNGLLPRDDFQRACARTGLQLTTREMDALCQKYDPELGTRVNIAKFLETMKQKIAVLQASSINPVRVKRLFKSMQELLAFKFDSADKAFTVFDENKSGRLEPSQWGSVFDTIGLQATPQEQTAVARYLDSRSDGSGGVDFRSFSKFWHNLPGTPGTELVRALEAWARRSGGKTPDELLAKAEDSFSMLDGQNERTLPLLEFVAALGAAGIRVDNPESVLTPFKQGVRYNYGLMLERMRSALKAAVAKWTSPDSSANAKRGNRPPSTAAGSRATGSSAQRRQGQYSRGNVRSSTASRGAPVPQSRQPSRGGSFPPIRTRVPTAASSSSRPVTSRTLKDSKRAALEAKLRAAQFGLARAPKVASKGREQKKVVQSMDEVDFETAVFACWKKLRALFVAADKQRSGRLPQKTVVGILLRNQIGSNPEELRTKTKAHIDDNGVNYNMLIKSILQSRSR